MKSFWKLWDFSNQNVYIRSSVGSHRVERKRIRDGTGSEKNILYSCILRGRTNFQTVCKKYFLENLPYRNGRFHRCVSKPEVHAVIDSRGKKSKNNRLDYSDIVAHIKSFPVYQSHYSRKRNPERKYLLPPDLYIWKMYELFVEKCQSEGKQASKETFYYHFFSTKFNLHLMFQQQNTWSRYKEFQLKIVTETNGLKRRGELELKNKSALGQIFAS